MLQEQSFPFGVHWTNHVDRASLLRQRRTVALAIALVALLVVVGIVVTSAAGGGGGAGSPLDAGLKSTAGRVAPSLNHPGGKLSIDDTSLRSFQAWVYDIRPALLRAARLSAHGQSEEAELIDPNTLPPVYVPLYQPGHVPVAVTADLLNRVTHSHQPAYATIRRGHASFRVYAVPLSVPGILRSAGVTGMFEVVQRE